MNKIQAIVVADSLSPQKHRLTSLVITFPRFILAELNTHRILSKNSASSRAIPFKKMVEMVKTNPFIPIAWQKEHTGMQGNEYWTENDKEFTHGNKVARLNYDWLSARDATISYANHITEEGATKQLANRLLEPFMYTTVLISGTEWENFFELRCPQYQPAFASGDIFKSIKDMAAQTSCGSPYYYDVSGRRYFDGMQCSFVDALKGGLNKGQAEIHMMALAEAIYDAMNESKPKQLQAGEWHIPFSDKINEDNLIELLHKLNDDKFHQPTIQESKIKISTAMAARTSYTVVGDEKEISYERLIGIHDKMAIAKPFHASPFEHPSLTMTEGEYFSYSKSYLYIGIPTKKMCDEASQGITLIKNINMKGINKDAHIIVEYGWCKNYRGFTQYRHILESK